MTLRHLCFPLFVAAQVTAFSSCGGNPEKTKTKSVFSGSHFFAFEGEDRLEMFDDLVHATRAKYSGWKIKAHLTGQDSNIISSDFREKIAVLPIGKTPFEQADLNMRFFDLLQAYLAAFQDAHLKIRFSEPRPRIHNGLQLHQIEGKAFVTGLVPRILSNSLPADLCGDSSKPFHCLLYSELLEVDDKPVDRIIEELTPYVSAGNSSNRRKSALTAITNRNFAYPENAVSTYKIRILGVGEKRIELPFYFNEDSARADAKYLLTHLGFRSSAFMFERFNEQAGDWEYEGRFVDGYSKSEPLSQMVSQVDFIGTEEQDPILRTGYILKEGKVFGVLQIFGFYEESVINSNDVESSFTEVVTDFMRELEEAKAPLILDLRNNPGGSGVNVKGLIKALQLPDKPLVGAYSSIPLTRTNRQMFDQLLEGPWPSETRHQEMRQYKLAVANQLDFTTPVESYNINSLDFKKETKQGSDGYSQKIIALISDKCISACEITSIILKQNKRATLLGTETQGTGMGFRSINHFGSSTYRYMDKFSTFFAQFPNALFGYATSSASETIYDTTTENRPIQADVKHSPTLEDFKSQGADITKKALTLILE